MMAWEVSHTFYTPDPATVEFFLLLKWKTSFKGRLQDTEDIRKKVTTQSNAFLFKSSDECFGKWL
jgi:hypothetical protein